jgi:hypothetical protein
MVYFPTRQEDGGWAAENIFKRRIPHTAEFKIDGPEFELYRDVTRFVKRQSARAAAQDDSRGRAVGFLMALFQRRLASSTHALRCSLENRARRLERGLERARELALLAPPELPDADELEEMDEAERERIEELIAAVSLTTRAADIRAEVAELRELADRARAVEEAGSEGGALLSVGQCPPAADGGAGGAGALRRPEVSVTGTAGFRHVG